MNMKKVYIVVEDGLVQAVYADEGNVEVELIDLDTTDPDEYEANTKAFEEMRKTTHIVY
jgi:hypothetical protein